MTAPTLPLNDNGRLWLVVLLRDGDAYGRDDCLTVEGGEPLVEFRDLTHADKFGPKGQFVSRYYRYTLMHADRSAGLNLDGGVPEWQLSETTMAYVTAWLIQEGA